MEFSALTQLPEELLQDILSRLSRSDLAGFSLSCRWAHRRVAGLLWQDVELVDCPDRLVVDGEDQEDEHNDAPIIMKLLVLAR